MHVCLAASIHILCHVKVGTHNPKQASDSSDHLDYNLVLYIHFIVLSMTFYYF